MDADTSWGLFVAVTEDFWSPLVPCKGDQFFWQNKCASSGDALEVEARDGLQLPVFIAMIWSSLEVGGHLPLILQC